MIDTLLKENVGAPGTLYHPKQNPIIDATRMCTLWGVLIDRRRRCPTSG